MKKLNSLIIFNLISIILGSSFTLLYDYYQKTKLADFVTTSQRNNIIVRDIAAFSGEISALSEIFFQIKIVDPVSEINIFKVDDSVHPQFTIKISKEIFNNKSLSNKLFDVDFYYSLAQPLVESLALWILISLALSPLFLFIQNKNIKRQAIENESKLNSRYAELARQVAHDIRSPLTALQAITSKVQQTNSEEHQMINEVFNRITTIANDLLDSTRKSEFIEPPKITSKANFEVFHIISSIIREKNLGLTNDIKINFDYSSPDKIFCNGVKTNFLGLLSNILQNSIESKIENADLSINIFLRDHKKYIEITIIDNGCGIPSNVLQELTTKELTYNKENGNGLGLYNAKKYLTAWGGDIRIFSQINSGTQVNIKLLRA